MPGVFGVEGEHEGVGMAPPRTSAKPAGYLLHTPPHTNGRDGSGNNENGQVSESPGSGPATVNQSRSSGAGA